LESQPEIVARGLIGTGDGNGFLKNAQRVVAEAVENASDVEIEDLSLLKERVRLELKRFIQKHNGTKPVIVPVIIEV
ncbi:MAG TPA: hypothetical protein VK619_13425, partial [Pyrinomonadaceae bacterium]|nr:hypothetical protein [Pyrinomonadaceae bacterium]